MKRSGQVLHEKVVKAGNKAWLHEQQIEPFKEVGGLSVFSVQPSDSHPNRPSQSCTLCNSSPIHSSSYIML
jgi:hypothetical protein